ncbi:cell wall hydrolase [Metallumcola ferriviriculae]|uniref:Cell wall hydrolase n=1 Tax=Metallumcola ferriviriculae TaxID=3039180 RepID=A0AAU0UHA6_9FIRM|nr:cell wall hydrolase [Desulfitibacteraceae bacterium MK1]
MKFSRWKMRIACLTLAFFLSQAFSAAPLAEAAGNYYIVQRGDSLWSIAQRHTMTVKKLKEINGLTGNIIYPEQRLTVIPVVASSSTEYIVKSGDNLWAIGKKFNISINTIRQMNKLSGNIIHPNQRLVLPERSGSHYAMAFRQLEHGIRQEQSSNKTADDRTLYWLARAISAEARGEPFDGQVAVGAVIVNRVKHSRFPNSVFDVVFQKSGGIYQFSPVKDGSIYREPSKEAIRAAETALAGQDPTNGALFFYNPTLTSRSNWIRTRPVAKVMNNHVFTL